MVGGMIMVKLPAPIAPITGPSLRIVVLISSCVICGLIWASAINGCATSFGAS